MKEIRRIIGIECTEKNGVVQDHVGLVLSGPPLPKDFKPFVILGGKRDNTSLLRKCIEGSQQDQDI